MSDLFEYKEGTRLRVTKEIIDDMTEHGIGTFVLARVGDELVVRSPKHGSSKYIHVYKEGDPDELAFSAEPHEVEVLQGTVQQIKDFEEYSKDRGWNLARRTDSLRRYAFAVADHAFTAWCDSPGYK